MSLRVERGDDGVALVTLDRPEARNALDTELLRALPAAMAELGADQAVRVVILTGADPAFCAGLDLKELGSTGANLGRATASADDVRPTTPWPRMDTVVIGAINGPAVTGGFELALNCDFLVASERARFGDTHARVGVMPGWGMSVLLPQAVGYRRALELSLTGDFLDAEEALRLGLVNHVVAHEELLPTARRIAAAIAGIDTGMVPTYLASYRRIAGGGVTEGLQLEAEASVAWRVRVAPEAVEQRRAAIVERGRSQL